MSENSLLGKKKIGGGGETMLLEGGEGFGRCGNFRLLAFVVKAIVHFIHFKFLYKHRTSFPTLTLSISVHIRKSIVKQSTHAMTKKADG